MNCFLHELLLTNPVRGRVTIFPDDLGGVVAHDSAIWLGRTVPCLGLLGVVWKEGLLGAIREEANLFRFFKTVPDAPHTFSCALTCVWLILHCPLFGRTGH